MKLSKRLLKLARNHPRHERKQMEEGTAKANLPVFRIIGVGGGLNGEGEKMTILTVQDHEGGKSSFAVPTADLVSVIAISMGLAPPGAEKPRPSPIFKPRLVVPVH